LVQWQNNGWLRPHATDREEIGNLLSIAHRDLSDAQSHEISDDWRFGIAYNAALKLCTALLYAEGYRPTHAQAHYRALQSLPLILGAEHGVDAKYLEACRVKRNTVELLEWCRKAGQPLDSAARADYAAFNASY
jgi:hypothetical protein